MKGIQWEGMRKWQGEQVACVTALDESTSGKDEEERSGWRQYLRLLGIPEEIEPKSHSIFPLSPSSLSFFLFSLLRTFFPSLLPSLLPSFPLSLFPYVLPSSKFPFSLHLNFSSFPASLLLLFLPHYHFELHFLSFSSFPPSPNLKTESIPHIERNTLYDAAIQSSRHELPEEDFWF